MPIWPAQPPESTAYAFNRDERARLTIYRAAVAAGFYTDACPEVLSAHVTSRLLAIVGAETARAA
jgi:hypothetical protein